MIEIENRTKRLSGPEQTKRIIRKSQCRYVFECWPGSRVLEIPVFFLFARRENVKKYRNILWTCTAYGFSSAFRFCRVVPARRKLRPRVFSYLFDYGFSDFFSSFVGYSALDEQKNKNARQIFPGITYENHTMPRLVIKRYEKKSYAYRSTVIAKVPRINIFLIFFFFAIFYDKNEAQKKKKTNQNHNGLVYCAQSTFQ